MPPARVNTLNTIVLQDWVGHRDDEKRILVFEGGNPKIFKEGEEFRTYLREFPEAENDTASRLFRYTSSCPANLMVALFEKYDFARFSLTPRGMSGDAGILFTTNDTGNCKCHECSAGTPCGHYALECVMSFWQLESSSGDGDNRLEIRGGTDSFTIFAGEQ
jgi:hypothetical protein